MPSNRKQLNVRLAPDAEGWMDEIQAAMVAELGFEVSQADVIRAALAELRKRYPSVEPGSQPQKPPEPEKPKRPRGRPKKT